MGLTGVDIAINNTEPIVVRAVPYFQKLFSVVQKYSKRYGVSLIIAKYKCNS